MITHNFTKTQLLILCSNLTRTSSSWNSSTGPLLPDCTNYSILRMPYPLPPEKPPFSLLLDDLNSYVIPAVLTFGLLGNAVSIVVFLCTSLKVNSLSHYLCALAVADLIYCLFCFVPWITTRSPHHLNATYSLFGVCQMERFSLLLSRFLATWYVFTAHVERFMAHFGSCRTQKQWCTAFRTKCIIIAIFVFSMVGFLHYSWMSVVEERNFGNKAFITCTYMEASVPYLTYLWNVELVITVFLPMVMITAIDVSLLVTVLKQCYLMPVRRMETNGRGVYVLANNQPSIESSRGVEDEEAHHGNGHVTSSNGCRSRSAPMPAGVTITREKVRATVAVVVVGVCFICTVLPASVYRSKATFFGKLYPDIADQEAMKFSEMLVKFNSAFKICIYMVVLKSFRCGLADLLKQMFCRENPRDALVPETSL